MYGCYIETIWKRGNVKIKRIEDGEQPIVYAVYRRPSYPEPLGVYDSEIDARCAVRDMGYQIKI